MLIVSHYAISLSRVLRRFFGVIVDRPLPFVYSYPSRRKVLSFLDLRLEEQKGLPLPGRLSRRHARAESPVSGRGC